MIERLKKLFGYNEPIFTDEILKVMNDYSRPRIFQLLNKAVKAGLLIKFDKGVYYIPSVTNDSDNNIIVDQVIRKKYISNNDETYGIYTGLNILRNILNKKQKYTDIEVVTNNETMSIRQVKLGDCQVKLRKSRIKITKQNVNIYTILEFFSRIDIKKYIQDHSLQNTIKSFIKKHKIKLKDLFSISDVFPSKTIKNIMMSGIITELS